MSRVVPLFLAVASTCALLAADSKPVPVVIPNAELFDLHSKSGRDYRIFIAKPDGPAPATGYSVYYFTDANNSFGAVASLARIQQRTTGPVVLVGIGYPTEDRNEITVRRTFDLTPPTDPAVLDRFREARARSGARRPAVSGPTASSMKTGGQEQLFDFIEHEVKPVIEKRFKIDKSQQALFGHSFGGLFTLHALFMHPGAYQSYIAASPSLWVNPETLEKEIVAFSNEMAKERKPVRVLITTAELEPRTPADRAPNPGEKTAANTNLRPQKTLLDRLTAAGVSTSYKEFEGENHGSVIPFAHMRGLRFAFEKPRP
jgi:predicted alpha/beta superfamily hydrolase